jgi:hypothetical protein
VVYAGNSFVVDVLEGNGEGSTTHRYLPAGSGHAAAEIAGTLNRMEIWVDGL